MVNTTTERLLKIKDACKYLSTSEATLHRLVAAGEVKKIKFLRSIRFDVIDLDNFINRAKGK